MQVLLQHREVRRRHGLWPIGEHHVALRVHVDLVPEDYGSDPAALGGLQLDGVVCGHLVGQEVELEDLEDIGQLPGAARGEGGVQVQHIARAVVVEDREVETVAVLEVLPELEGRGPDGGTCGDDLVLEGVAHLDARGVEQHQDALAQEARIEELAYYQLRTLRLARELAHVLRAEEDVPLQVVLPEDVPRQADDLGHLLDGNDVGPMRLDVLVRDDAGLVCELRRQHRDLAEACTEVHDPQRVAVELGDMLTLLHDLLQRLPDGLPEGVCTLLVQGAEEKPAGASHLPLLLRCLRRHDLEAHPRAAVGRADVDLVAPADLQRSRKPLRGVPVVLSTGRRSVGMRESLGRVVNADVGREGHAVPEHDAVQHAVLRGDEVEVGLAAHPDLALREVKLEDLVDRAEGAPGLAEPLVVQVRDLVERAPAGLVPGAPVEAVWARAPRADDLAGRAHDRGPHGHHEVVRGDEFPLHVVDLGKHTLPEEPRVEELVVHDDAVHPARQVVDVLPVGVNHRQLV
mmetsp:Transcript_3771/g.11525  ORF Transcript_3771/g.11525 Transcript_3771/m.11525 type:complete len:516 (+) Transcript_3771:475-2022(+)